MKFVKEIKNTIPGNILTVLVLVFGAGILLFLLELYFSIVFMASFFPRFFTKIEILCLVAIFTIKVISKILEIAVAIFKMSLEKK